MSRRPPWTEGEVAELRRLAADHTAVEIAAVIGRSEGSVRHHARRLGLRCATAGTGRARADYVSERSDYQGDDEQPTQWVGYETRDLSATTSCTPQRRIVTLAACIDGYTDATAHSRGTPCDGCAAGARRRRDYARTP